MQKSLCGTVLHLKCAGSIDCKLNECVYIEMEVIYKKDAVVNYLF